MTFFTALIFQNSRKYVFFYLTYFVICLLRDFLEDLRTANSTTKSRQVYLLIMGIQF